MSQHLSVDILGIFAEKNILFAIASCLMRHTYYALFLFCFIFLNIFPCNRFFFIMNNYCP